MAHQRTVVATSQFINGRKVNSRVPIKDKPAIGRKRHLVSSVTFRQYVQVAAVEVDSTEMFVIRVLVFGNANRVKPDDAIVAIDVFDASDVPVALCDSIDHFPGLDVVAVEVVPA